MTAHEAIGQRPGHIASTEPRPVDLGDVSFAVPHIGMGAASTEPRPVDLGDRQRPRSWKETLHKASTEPRPVDLGDVHRLLDHPLTVDASTEPRPVDLGDWSPRVPSR